MDEPYFDEGELTLTESIVDDDASHIPIMLASNTTNRIIRERM